MSTPPPSPPPPQPGRPSKPREAGDSLKSLFEWFDRRTGFNTLMHESLDEPIPGGARFAYVFGSGLLYLFLSQIITGVFLAFYYVPSADHAHTTVAYITKEVSAGSFLRSLHAYGSSAMVIVLILHMTQTFVYGSYKGRRELLWASGCLLAALVISMAFTGYLLPWDQKAYFATAVGTNIASEIPLIGNMMKLFMRGGADMGTLTLSRFFVFHVFLIPGLIFLFVAVHVYLFRKAGAAGPVEEDPVRPQLPTERFYPRQVLMDLAFGFTLMCALGAAAYFVPAELGPKANPADTLYVPRPEWYYLPIFQWLKYWTGPLVVVGVVVLPAIVAALFVGLPFIDTGPERRPWKRPVAVSFFGALLFSLLALGGLSYRDDLLDVGIAMQLAKQQAETEEFMKAPFEPEESAPSLAVARTALEDPQAARGREVYDVEFCNGCHGDGGVGTPVGTALIGLGAGMSPESISSLLRTPTPPMEDGGMFALEIPDEDMSALVAYLVSLE